MFFLISCGAGNDKSESKTQASQEGIQAVGPAISVIAFEDIHYLDINEEIIPYEDAEIVPEDAVYLEIAPDVIVSTATFSVDWALINGSSPLDQGQKVEGLASFKAIRLNIIEKGSYEFLLKITDENGLSEHYSFEFTRSKAFVSEESKEFMISGKIDGLKGTGALFEIDIDGETSIANLMITDNRFELARLLKNNNEFELKIKIQPKDPDQFCTVLNGVRMIENADIDNIEIICIDQAQQLPD